MKREATYVYSFPKTNRSQSLEKLLTRTVTPGPGNYNPNHVYLKSFTKVSIGKSNRGDYIINKNFPSVGKYEISNQIGTDAPRITMSARFNSNNRNILTPGPGAYETDINPIKLTHPKYTIRKKSKHNDPNSNLPGPDKYKVEDIVVHKYRPQSVQFGKEKKFRYDKYTYQITPAPGKYDLKDDLALSTNPKIKIQGEHKSTKKVENYKPVPGPGSYLRLDKDNDSVKVHMSFHRPIDQMFCHTKNPGPGIYNPGLSNKKKAPSITFEKSLRPDVGKNDVPAVGKYELNVNPIKEKLQNVIIGKSKRSDTSISTINNPPVGKYTIEGKLGQYGPKYSFYGTNIEKKANKKDFITPGPGEYDNSKLSISYRQSNWKFGTEKRDYNPFQSSKEKLPGPGAYTLGKPGETNKSIFIGKSKRSDQKKMEVPGPGHYKIPCSLFDFPNFIQVQGFDTKYKYL